MPIQTRTGLGIMLALIGGLLISIDIPIIRLANTDPWFFMFARGIGVMLVLGLILMFATSWTDTPKRPFHDLQWLEVGLYTGISNIFFTMAVYNTSTANLVFILAFNPMLAALFAWALYGEKPDVVTWIAIALTIFGVGIIVNTGLKGGTLFGDMFALAASVTLAISIVRIRQSGKDMSLSACYGGMITAAFALPFVVLNLQLPSDPSWLLLNVLILVPVASFCLHLAPRYIAASQVSMFFLLETVLAPIWVWMIFGEVPPHQTLFGGAIVVFAIFMHSAWQIYLSSQRRKLRTT